MFSRPTAGLIRQKSRDNALRRSKNLRQPIRTERIAEPAEPMDIEEEQIEASETQRRRTEKARGKRPVKPVEDPMDQEGENEEEGQNDVDEEFAEQERDQGERSKSEVIYSLLKDHIFMGTRFPQKEAMDALGIREDVELVFKNMGLEQFMRMYAGGYKDETCQFLATLQLHHYNNNVEEMDNGLGWISFWVNGKEYSLSYRALDNLYGFESGMDTAVDYEESELKALWKTVAMGTYTPSRSKSAQIRSPVLRYVHKALASTFFARTVTGHVTEGELQLLDKGLKPILKRLRGGETLKGDTSDTGLLVPFLDQLMSYQDTVYMYRNRTSAASLFVGGVITPILIACDVPLDDSDYTPHGWLDINYLKRAKILEHKEVEGKYIYKFDHPDGGVAKILLPNQSQTRFRNGRNVDFNPSTNALYHRGQRQAPPEPMEEDVEVETAGDEQMGEPERYYFEEYPCRGSAPAVVAAHKRIGLLQKLNKWQAKTMDQLKKTVGSMAKTIKSLDRKVRHSTTRRHPPPPFRRSRSLIHTARRPSTQEPPRSSSFEPREAERQRQKKRRSSSSRHSDFTGELDRDQPGFNEQLERAPADLSTGLDRGKEEGSSQNVDFSSEYGRAAMVEYSAPDGRLPTPVRDDILADLFGYH